MRRAERNPNSAVLAQELRYIPGNSRNNAKIATELLKEQQDFCAYTDEYISRTDARDIDHFNPTLKGKPEDGYANWFVVKHQWNLEKQQKWAAFQPALSPDHPDFEDRITYADGDYLYRDGDTEARNLIHLLNLNDQQLAEKRKRYLKRKRDEMNLYGDTADAYFSALISSDVSTIAYPRAIREEFDVDVLRMIAEAAAV